MKVSQSTLNRLAYVIAGDAPRGEDEPPKYDGELTKLYKRVSQRLNIGTDRKDIRDDLLEVLRGVERPRCRAQFSTSG